MAKLKNKQSDESVEDAVIVEDTAVAVLKPEVKAALVVPTVFRFEDKEVNKLIVTEKRDEAMLIIIDGIDDKDGLKKATELRAELRTTRTSLEKHRKLTSEPFNAYLKGLKATTDELGSIARQGEDHLDAEIKKIEKAKADKKAEDERLKLEAMNKRISEVFKLGAEFNGEVYSFPYDPVLGINATQIKEFDDEEWGYFIEDATKAYDLEQQRIADELAEEEKNKVAIQNQAAENLVVSKELDEKRTKLRIKELQLNGFVKQQNVEYGGEVWELNGYTIGDRGIISVDDETWDIMIEEALNPAEETPVAQTEAPVEAETNAVDELDKILENSATWVNDVVLHFDHNNAVKIIQLSQKFSLVLSPASQGIEIGGDIAADVNVPGSDLRIQLLKT